MASKSFADLIADPILGGAVASDDVLMLHDRSAVAEKGLDISELSTAMGLGTLSTQDDDAVAITGGSIDAATIGATTPVTAQARRPINTQTVTSYTLVASDAGKFLSLNNESAITLTVPPHSDVAFPVGAEIDIAQIGGGTVTVVGGSGVTIMSLNSLTDLAGQYAGGTLKQLVNDYWLLVGALA